MAAPVSSGSRTATATRTAQGTEDVNFTLPNNTDHIILGCGVTADASDELDQGDLCELQFRTGADAFAQVTGVSTVALGNTDLVNDNTLTSGERLTTGGTYLDGIEVEATAPTHVEKVNDATTEFQWSLDFSGAASDTTYDFRVRWQYKNGTANINYISITTATGAVTGAITFTTNVSETNSNLKTTANSHTIAASLNQVLTNVKTTANAHTFATTLDLAGTISKLLADSQTFAATLDQVNANTKTTSESGTFGSILDEVSTNLKTTANAHTLSTTLDQVSTNIKNTANAHTFSTILDQVVINGKLVTDSNTFSVSMNEVDSVNKITTAADTFSVTLDQPIANNKITVESGNFSITLDEVDINSKITDVAEIFLTNLSQVEAGVVASGATFLPVYYRRHTGFRYG